MGKMKDILTKVKNSVFPSTKAKTEKEIATENGEPYIKVIQVDFPEGDACLLYTSPSPRDIS